MKAIITHPTSVDGRSTLASIGIAKFLSKTLGIPIKDRSTGKAEKYDIILMVNGPPAFCNWREEMAAMVAKCKTFVFIQNDYTIAPPSQVGKVMRKRGWVDEKGVLTPPHVWGTIEDKLKTNTSALVNWNVIKFIPPTSPWPARRFPGIFYYGAYRAGREEYFKKYLATKRYEVTVSASTPARKKFELLNPSIKLLSPMDPGKVTSQLLNYRASIYIEDEYSHRHYCSPANRFYECLAAGVAQFVDENAAHTLLKGGFDVTRWVVNSDKDVEKLLPSAKLIAEMQREQYVRDFTGPLKRQVRKLYRQLERSIK